jgi:Fic family protein
MVSVFKPAVISIDSEVIKLLEKIARMQGELSAHPHSFQEQTQIASMANIDAVHFSTKIEGNHLSRHQVTEALNAKVKKALNHDLKEVLNYSRARKLTGEWAIKNKPFNEEWILSHHKELLNGIVKGKLRGPYRTAQCVIQDSKTGAIVYMAADHHDVPRLMKGLLTWLRQQKTSGASPLLIAAQFHYQLVTIHPFMDGNGRLARLLTNGILTSSGYDVERFSALEKQHEKDRTAYYRTLRSLQASNFYDIPDGQDIRSWIIYWLNCLLGTYEEALARVNSTKSQNAHSLESPDFSDRLKKAQSLFRRHVKLRASEYADLMALARTQAVADLNSLTEQKFIEKIGGGRSTIYKLKSAQKGRVAKIDE